MFRCETAGRFRVTMLTQDKVERRQFLGAHADVYEEVEVNGARTRTGKVLEESPIFSNATPYEGELCEHELMALNNPVKFVSPELIFRIEKLD